MKIVKIEPSDWKPDVIGNEVAWFFSWEKTIQQVFWRANELIYFLKLYVFENKENRNLYLKRKAELKRIFLYDFLVECFLQASNLFVILALTGVLRQKRTWCICFSRLIFVCEGRENQKGIYFLWHLIRKTVCFVWFSFQ